MRRGKPAGGGHEASARLDGEDGWPRLRLQPAPTLPPPGPSHRPLRGARPGSPLLAAQRRMESRFFCFQLSGFSCVPQTYTGSCFALFPRSAPRPAGAVPWGSDRVSASTAPGPGRARAVGWHSGGGRVRQGRRAGTGTGEAWLQASPHRSLPGPPDLQRHLRALAGPPWPPRSRCGVELQHPPLRPSSGWQRGPGARHEALAA